MKYLAVLALATILFGCQTTQKQETVVSAPYIKDNGASAQTSKPASQQYDALSGATPVDVSEADNGKEVTLPLGELLVITLESNPTTGYMWIVTKQDTESLLLVKKELVTNTSDSGLVGAGGHEVLMFTARKKGQTSLQLEYRRPWETISEKPAEVFSLTVNAGMQ